SWPAPSVELIESNEVRTDRGGHGDGPNRQSSEDEHSLRTSRAHARLLRRPAQVQANGESERQPRSLRIRRRFRSGLVLRRRPRIAFRGRASAATWMELKVDDTAAWKARLLAFGV